MKPRTPETYREAIDLYEHALALDPQSIEAQSRLAAVLVDSVTTGMTDSASAASDVARADGLVGRALAASPRMRMRISSKARCCVLGTDGRRPFPNTRRRSHSNHNWVYAVNTLGWCRFYFGSIDEVIPLVEQAIRLSPRDPQLGAWYQQIGLCICCNRNRRGGRLVRKGAQPRSRLVPGLRAV